MPQVFIAAAAWIGTAVTTVTTSAALGAAAANAIAALGFAQGIGAGLTAWSTLAGVASLARGRPRVGGPQGTQVDFKADPNAGIPYVIGETGVAGNIVFATTAEVKNQHLLYLTAYTAAGPIEGFTGFKVNDELTSFSLENANGRYHNFMWLRTQVGGPVQVFPPPATTLASFPEWTDAHKLTGYAASWWVLEYDAKKYPTGTPKPLMLAKWVKAYDPRLDSTYPGGSGGHRPDNEDTWQWTANPFLHALTWCIGRRSNGKLILGVGAPIELIDVAAFVEGANVCDANGWEAHGQVYSTDDKWQVLAAMLQAGGGWPTAQGAKISCGVNSPKVSLATLTGADQAGGEVTIQAVRSRRDRFNAVIPRYRSEAHGFSIVSAARISVATYLAEDGEDSTIEPEFTLCQDVDQASQLGLYTVANSREFGPIVVPCKPRWWGYRPNDCITINEPEWGLEGQKVVILSRDRDPQTGVVTLTLQTETDAKHPFALGQTGTAPPTPGLGGPDGSEVPLPDPGSWNVDATFLSGADGVLPALVITGGVDTGLVTHIIVDYREVLGGGAYGPWASQEFPSSSSQLIVTGLKPATLYQVRIRYRTARGIEDPNNGTDLGDHTTGNVGVGTIGGLTIADLLTSLAGVEDLANTLSKWVLLQSSIQEAIKRLGLTPDGLPVGPFVKETKQLADDVVYDVSLIGLRNEAGTLFDLSSTTLRIDGELLGQKLDVIAGQAGDALAQVVAETNLRIAGDAANASQITTLTSTVGGHTSTLTTHASTLATLDGRTQAYLEFHAAAGGDPAYAKLLATGTGSAIMLAATEIALFNVSGGNVVIALKLIGGQAYFGAPVSIDVGGRRLTLGPGFGASADLVMWFGPNSVAIGSMTKTNGHWAFATDGKVYYGTGELGTGGGFRASASHTYVEEHTASVPATLTTANVTATPSGAPGAVSYQWVVSNSDIQILAPTNSATAFRTSALSVGKQVVQGVATCILTSGGQQTTISVGVGFFYDI